MKKISIEIDDDLYAEIMRVSKELDTQDNRATADPYYYTIKQDTIMPTSHDYSDDYIWVDEEGDLGEPIEQDLYDINDFKDFLFEKGLPEDEIKEYLNEYQITPFIEDYLEEEFSIRKIYITKYTYNTNVFLTETAAKNYIKADNHNLSGEKVINYIEYANKNKELYSIIQFLKQVKNHK